MNNATKFRMACIVLLWIALCYLVVTSRPFAFMTLFVIVASGIIVFVPLYKKHVRGKSNNTDEKHNKGNGRA